MEIDLKKFRRSLQGLLRIPDAELRECLRLWTSTSGGSMDKTLEVLSVRLLDPLYTEVIRDNFPDMLMVIVTKAIPIDCAQPDRQHVAKCVALSKLVANSQHIRKFAQQLFAVAPPPFSVQPSSARPKRAKSSATSATDLQIVQTCHRFLKSDTIFYRYKWNWSQFVQRFHNRGCAVQQLHCNAILATLANMSTQQLQSLNRNIEAKFRVDRSERDDNSLALAAVESIAESAADSETPGDDDDSQLYEWQFNSDVVTCVQGVFLSIFNLDNYRYHQQQEQRCVATESRSHLRTVLVRSTRANLRSLALGIGCDKLVCLSGPVGCGKTSLVEYVARRTGRVAIPWSSTSSSKATVAEAVTVDSEAATPTTVSRRKKGKKRAAIAQIDAAVDAAAEDEERQLQDGGLGGPAKNGFLRIQLGDQTDSKMLLGQYRCTDVPGEFVWQAGVLTQAVMHGYWLLLEDIDLATQDVTVALTNLMENNYLSVPGLNDCLRIAPGFQLFVTLRNQKQSNCTQQSNLQMLNKYMYVVNMLPLSATELAEMVNEMYPRFRTVDAGIVDRMVRVFLKFSCGDHAAADIASEAHSNGAPEAVAYDQQQQLQQRQSNRLVSTRDLLKWCSRSSAAFCDTSEAARFLVLKNAVDLFCGHLPDVQKLQLIQQIGVELNISIGMCETFASEHLPRVQVTSEEVVVGRAMLRKHQYADEKSVASNKRAAADADNDDEDDGGKSGKAAKKLKTADNRYRNVFQANKVRVPTFSFTRPACCIMERIAVAIAHCEPVLLVGETGVGKTSSVQYLAHHTNHRLVVVNMNNQSDVSDLVGGFKPVDLAFVLAPLRTEFETLFKRTFNAAKNEKFLSHLSVCFQRSEFVVLIKLMLRIVQTVVDGGKQPQAVAGRWLELRVKLQKMEAQLSKSINISFAFIVGSLVKCIQNGDWVLLDEINLASAETLECLSTILEPDGSIVLLEKGDLVPVQRHPNFRIFACMNPSTDVGKKELPVGIRNRFSEFYVDELDKLADLEILIRDYLLSTGIPAAKVNGIARMYGQLRQLARLDLNDGLGNRPVFSLRTLCRALTICAKNLCGSVERNLYESFCLSFLTQLDPGSHARVLQLIQATMLGTNVKAVLQQQIPKPPTSKGGVEYIQFEGYWIEAGCLEPQPCESYILTDSVRLNLKDLARIISIGRLPVLLQGPTSAGKTSLIEYVAKRSGNRCMRINNHEHTDLQEYIGAYTADADGKLQFREGVLVDAMRNGHWIILDELNLASSDILEALNRVLDDNRELFIAETQTLVRAHPNFMLFATQNPPGLYGGRKALSRAFKNRFIELHFAEIPRAELEVILERRCLLPKRYAVMMVKTMSELHNRNRQSSGRSSFTLRDLFRWGQRYTLADRALLAVDGYDWNQHLVDEGYLALSAKIRTDADCSVVEEALCTHFRKRISLANLFELSDSTSLVTKTILQAIAAHPRFERIVWTFNMRRMAVLAAKALQFDEPVLLVGSTGCGKTTVCQILADIAGRQLRILNCHMHSEGGDFLGGLRPYRGGDQADAEDATTDGEGARQRKLFEWSNGPLVLSMLEGSYFLADEISLAEDSVLERLNCILEPERTVLLSEKGGGTAVASADLIVKAAGGFQFLATMNPGGDFGKKELSPALRNRFTEIWCRATDTADDLCRIAEHTLRTNFAALQDARVDTLIADLAAIVVDSVFYMRRTFAKFQFSIRDVLAWIDYISKHARLQQAGGALSLPEALVLGMETLFLDALEMLPHESVAEVDKWRAQALQFLLAAIRRRLQTASTLQLAEVQAKKGTAVELSAEQFGIRPFYLPRRAGAALDGASTRQAFVFSAPTTQRNLFCLLSALSLHKPILLEGPPGVGKTSLIEQVTAAIGYNIVRINLCEHTDLADLFGSDLPATKDEESGGDGASADDEALGTFVWRDGPLLAALRAPNTWILLDELNLAPQSVLEGLNAVLDHRGEVYIPELNKSFALGPATRIFASQNPLKQGGGRKGLPQSFLNRFTKVYLRKLQSTDLQHVVRSKYGRFFEECSTAGRLSVDLCEAMVAFTERLDAGLAAFEFGYKGGPFEVNLRDILRWCEFLTDANTGGDSGDDQFLRSVFQKMKLVYCQRMRTPADKAYILTAFSQCFGCDAEQLERQSTDISLFWTDEAVYLDDIACSAPSDDGRSELESVSDFKSHANAAQVPLLMSSQREVLKNLSECMLMQKPVVLCGPTDCGKTKTIDVLCTLINRASVMDTIDDSVMGSYQQIDLNRHLEEMAVLVEELLTVRVQYYALQEATSETTAIIVRLLNCWENYALIAGNAAVQQPESVVSADLVFFQQRLQRLQEVFATIDELHIPQREATAIKQHIRTRLSALHQLVQHTNTLNSGGHFEWVDSRIVSAFKYGHIICLEHVNLCSSAILDRLNPMFETDGTLLLAEKGVSAATDQPEVVTKHPQFNAFLTLDPKNGEISRAMRNRCIELHIANESYTADDLKSLIYKAGVHEMYLIEAILAVHQRCQTVSEFSAMGVAHITKCADLVVRQRQLLGASGPEAVLRSATEVYVRSANIDLSGFGLAFYRGQLQQAIAEVVHDVQPRADRFDYGNVIQLANNMTALTLVRQQCELFLTVLRALCDAVASEELHSELGALFSGITDRLTGVQFDELLCKLLLTVSYECASPADLQLRRLYLNGALDGIAAKASEENATLIETMRQLNEQLYSDVCAGAGQRQTLPWNWTIFPRLRRHYQSSAEADAQALQRPNQLRLSALLAARALLLDVSCEVRTTKLSQIDARTFSLCVQHKRMQNVPNNELIQHLHAYLAAIKPHLVALLQLDNWPTLAPNEQANLVGSFLWHNRLLAVSERQLFVNKRVDDGLVNLLAIHIKWLEKHFLAKLPSLLPAGNQFERARSAMVGVLQSTEHPMHRLRKKFVKQLTRFAPLYEEAQIDVHDKIVRLTRETALLPAMGSGFDKAVVRRRLDILSDARILQLKSRLATADGSDQWIALQQRLGNAVNVGSRAVGSDSALSASVESFVKRINALATANSEDIDLDESFEYLQQLIEAEGPNELKSNRFVADLLPVREYFALKSLNTVLLDQSEQHPINRKFFEAIQSLDIGVLRTLRNIEHEAFAVCEQLWYDIWHSGDDEQLVSHLDKLPAEFYRDYASFRRRLTAELQQFALLSLATKRSTPSSDDGITEFQWGGPIFTSASLLALLDPSGQAKSCGLLEINSWQQTLAQFSQLLWSNVDIFHTDFQFEHANLHSSLARSNQLLQELDTVVADFHTKQPNCTEFVTDFITLIDTLKSVRSEVTNQELETPAQRSTAIRLASAISTLIGAIEINLLTHLPLLDPVEKHRLQALYATEDQQHLLQLLGAFECMQVTMNYAELGAEHVQPYQVRLAALGEQTDVQNVPRRPTECAYGNLLKDITHFMQTCCQPRALLDLYRTAQLNCDENVPAVSGSSRLEAIKRIELWINNSCQFVQHTLSKYAPYYLDFVVPLRNSITMLTHGLQGLKHCLQLRSTLANADESLTVNSVLTHLVEFPQVAGLCETNASSIVRVLAHSDRFDAQYLRLLKVKLREIETNITLSNTITADNIASLGGLLHLFNGVWQKQEELRRQRAVDDESLYVTKTRCAEEDENEVAEREVRTMFPNTIDTDFGDLIEATASLEQQPERPDTRAGAKGGAAKAALPDILEASDISQIVDTFAKLMSRFAQSYYHRQPARGNSVAESDDAAEITDAYVRNYKHKFAVFRELFGKLHAGLGSRIDESAYGGVSLLVASSQHDMNALSLGGTPNVSYNFYKDANIAEVITCVDILQKIEKRASVELAQYPEHAGLLDILSIIGRVRSFAITSPVVRFSTGFQILNKKLNEWNKLAHRNNTMIDLEVEVGGYIQRWMKLELQCWRECLGQSLDKVQARAHRYWFFIFNLVQEYLQSDTASAGSTTNALRCNLADFEQVERSLDEAATATGADSEPPAAANKLKSLDVINVLKRFVESANYADFETRMQILKSFEQYLYLLTDSAHGPNWRRKNTLITILHNVHLYFGQFTAEIEAKLKVIRAGVEKKLKEFVKMESYSKYLSYFSQDANIGQVHRKLHKFLKDFELQVGEKISVVFTMREAHMSDALNAEKTATKKSKSAAAQQRNNTMHIVDVQHFICATKPPQYYSALDAWAQSAAAAGEQQQQQLQLLPKSVKLFATARNIVKHSILHSQYPGLIYNLNTLVGDHIESLDYLRALEVDRSQEKPRQKVQAKQILQQKRKALTDFYKVLARLGFSYRAGLMESGLTAELCDLKIAPFAVRPMLANSGQSYDANLLALGDAKLDAYFVRSVYKLRLLQTVLLTPHADLGMQHLERIKGFGIDMFLLVQAQRKALSAFALQLNELQARVSDVAALRISIDSWKQEEESSTATYDYWRRKYTQMRADLAAVCDVALQYQLLLKCPPTSSSTEAVLLNTSSNSNYTNIRMLCTNMLSNARKLLTQLGAHEDVVFFDHQTIGALNEQYATVRSDLDAIIAEFAIDANNTQLHSRAARDLRSRLQSSDATIGQDAAHDEPMADDENAEFSSTNVEIENTIHLMLLAMQGIYKQHSDHELQSSEGTTIVKSPAGPAEAGDGGGDDGVDPIELNHLKVLLSQRIHSDVQLLGVQKITSKLANILLAIRHSADAPAKLAAAEKITCVLPILEQYRRLCDFYVLQQLGAHRVSSRMLAIVLTVFVELGAKGFCVPPDLMSDEDGDAGENKEEKGSEGFGLEDGTGEKDVSDKLESEDQLDSAKKPGDDKETDDKEDADCKEEKGIDMSEDFDSKLQDLEKKEPTSDSDDNDDDDEEADKQMGETEDGAEKLDDQIWGSDEEKDEEEEEQDQEMNDEDEGKGSKDEDEVHNDLGNENNETKQGDEDEQRDGLDAADNEQQEKKKKENDIDTMDEPDVGDDQANPYHNELEEPPEPEDVDLGDNFNLDKEDANDNEDRPEENPFDIDTMKDQMEPEEKGDEDVDESEQKDDDANDKEDGESDSDGETEDANKRDDKPGEDEEAKDEEDGDAKLDEEEDQPNDPTTAPNDEPEQPETGGEPEKPEDEEEQTTNKHEEDFRPSNDKASKEENAQSMPDEQKAQSSLDQVQKQSPDEEQQPQKQDDMDAQDTGEDQQAIGQAENEESKSGHQGIAETKETKQTEQQNKRQDTQEKRKQGNTDEERTLGDPEQQEKRQLKTIDKVNTDNRSKDADNEADEPEDDKDTAEEYQHVKEATRNDKTTLDNATEEQSKRVQHEDEANKDEAAPEDDEMAVDEDQLADDNADVEEQPPLDELHAEENERNSDKPASKRDRQRDEKAEQPEPIEVEGDYVDTHTVQRAAESSAHCAMELLHDNEPVVEPSALDALEMRKMFEKERTSNKLVNVSVDDFEAWSSISNKMLPNARELCEQLRLILEPTKCTRLKGDYRTGRRINLKKIIPYIASQFRKDKIWLRRTKPAQRDYKITVAIDDSKSMAHNNSKVLTLEAISLLSQALTLLESGRLSIMSFGEQPQIILDHSAQFDGPRLCSELRFDQNQSRIAEMLNFARVAGAEDGGGGGGNGVFENLLLILSDGRNVFSEGETVVRNAVKLARMQRIFIVYIIIDNPENKHSILDIATFDFKTMTKKSYMDSFPFPYYVIVRDLAQLPLVLSDAMRQWFELVNSEQ